MSRKKRLEERAVLDETARRITHCTDIQAKKCITPKKIYHAAAYIRLSVADSGKENGESLENQILMVTDYIRQCEDMILYQVYIDNGATGVHFSRTHAERY